MAASTKEELVAVSAKEFDKLIRLLEQLDAEVALAKDADDTSIKDVIGHRAHWLELFFGWYAAGQDGRAVHIPAEGVKWNELKQYNAHLRAQQMQLGWEEATQLLHRRYDEFVAWIDSKSDAELYGGPMVGGNNNWTPGRWAEAAGPSHFRSASKYVRARLRS